MKKRNRSRPVASLGERLQKFSDEAQSQADLCPPGAKRDALEEKEQADGLLTFRIRKA